MERSLKERNRLAGNHRVGKGSVNHSVRRVRVNHSVRRVRVNEQSWNYRTEHMSSQISAGGITEMNSALALPETRHIKTVCFIPFLTILVVIIKIDQK